MVDRPPEEEPKFLRERAAKLRMVAVGMPPSVETQLLHIAFELEKRAARLEASQSVEGGEGV